VRTTDGKGEKIGYRCQKKADIERQVDSATDIEHCFQRKYFRQHLSGGINDKLLKGTHFEFKLE
jgi:hypothetical protein